MVCVKDLSPVFTIDDCVKAAEEFGIVTAYCALTEGDTETSDRQILIEFSAEKPAEDFVSSGRIDLVCGNLEQRATLELHPYRKLPSLLPGYKKHSSPDKPEDSKKEGKVKERSGSKENCLLRVHGTGFFSTPITLEEILIECSKYGEVTGYSVVKNKTSRRQQIEETWVKFSSDSVAQLLAKAGMLNLPPSSVEGRVQPRNAFCDVRSSSRDLSRVDRELRKKIEKWHQQTEKAAELAEKKPRAPRTAAELEALKKCLFSECEDLAKQLLSTDPSIPFVSDEARNVAIKLCPGFMIRHGFAQEKPVWQGPLLEEEMPWWSKNMQLWDRIVSERKLVFEDLFSSVTNEPDRKTMNKLVEARKEWLKAERVREYGTVRAKISFLNENFFVRNVLFDDTAQSYPEQLYNREWMQRLDWNKLIAEGFTEPLAVKPPPGFNVQPEGTVADSERPGELGPEPNLSYHEEYEHFLKEVEELMPEDREGEKRGVDYSRASDWFAVGEETKAGKGKRTGQSSREKAVSQREAEKNVVRDRGTERKKSKRGERETSSSGAPSSSRKDAKGIDIDSIDTEALLMELQRRVDAEKARKKDGSSSGSDEEVRRRKRSRRREESDSEWDEQNRRGRARKERRRRSSEESD